MQILKSCADILRNNIYAGGGGGDIGVFGVGTANAFSASSDHVMNKRGRRWES